MQNKSIPYFPVIDGFGKFGVGIYPKKGVLGRELSRMAASLRKMDESPKATRDKRELASTRRKAKKRKRKLATQKILAHELVEHRKKMD